MKLLEQFNAFRKSFLKFETATLEDGMVVEYTDLVEGAEIFVVLEDEKNPIPDGDYLIDGKTITTEAGVITVITPVEEDVPAEDAPAETEEAEEVPAETEGQMSLVEENEQRFLALENTLKSYEEMLQEIMTNFGVVTDAKDKLELTITELDASNVKLKEEITIELAKFEVSQVTPIAVPQNIEVKETKMTLTQKINGLKR